MAEEVVYVSQVRVERIKGPYRRAYLPAEAEPVGRTEVSSDCVWKPDGWKRLDPRGFFSKPLEDIGQNEEPDHRADNSQAGGAANHDSKPSGEADPTRRAQVTTGQILSADCANKRPGDQTR